MPAHMTLNVVMPYTGEEESWLTRQLFLVDEAFKSIPIRKNYKNLELNILQTLKDFLIFIAI